MAAARANLLEVLTPGRLRAPRRAQRPHPRRAARRVIEKHGLPGYAVGVGSKGCVTFSPEKIVDYETFKANQDAELAELAWLFNMNRGIFMTPGREEEWTLSVTHTDEAVDTYVARVRGDGGGDHGLAEQVGEPAGVGGGEVRHAHAERALDREVRPADRPDHDRRAAERAQRLRVAGDDERAGALAEQQCLALRRAAARGRRGRRCRPRGSTRPARTASPPSATSCAERSAPARTRLAHRGVERAQLAEVGLRAARRTAPRRAASPAPSRCAAGAHEPAEMTRDDVALLREAEAAGALGLRQLADQPDDRGREDRPVRRPRCRATRCRPRPGRRARGRRRRGPRPRA